MNYKEIAKNKGLTDKEVETSGSMIRQGRRFVSYMNTMRKIYNILCHECQTRVFCIVKIKPEERTQKLSDLNTYCKDCRDKIKPYVKKLEVINK